jgi:hypothetical protein
MEGGPVILWKPAVFCPMIAPAAFQRPCSIHYEQHALMMKSGRAVLALHIFLKRLL